MEIAKASKEEFISRISNIERFMVEDLKGTIVEDLVPTVVSSDYEKGTVDFKLSVKPTMRNSHGIVHGGITSTILDNAMGMAGSSFINKGWTPTVNLQVSYIKPVKPEGTINISVRIVSVGRTFINTSADLWEEGKPERVLVSATGIFYIKE